MRAKAAVDGNDDVIGAVFAYSNRIVNPGEAWQSGLCEEFVNEMKLPIVCYVGTTANLFDNDDPDPEYVVGSAGEDTEAGPPPCCPDNTSAESFLEYYWDSIDYGPPYSTFNVAMSGTSPQVLLWEPLETELDMDLWTHNSVADNVCTGYHIAIGDTGTEVVTWLPYRDLANGKLKYKYREDDGAWSTYDLDDNTTIYGYPHSVDTKENGSMVLIYTSGASGTQSVKCAVVPPGGGQNATIYTVADNVESTWGLAEMDVFDDQVVVAVDYMEDEESNGVHSLAYTEI